MNNQKELEKKNKNKKRKLLIVSGISVLTVIGGTLAYFTTSTSLANKFKAALYQNTIKETFTAPTSWTPGTTTEKKVEVTNTGNIDMAVRASYTEKWVNANGEELPLKDANNNIAAIINFNDEWEKSEDGYYYYGTKQNMNAVKPEETTSSFITGVTFNENIESSLKETVSDDGKTITYTSTGEGYDNATYTLTITIDTIQYDQANNIW